MDDAGSERAALFGFEEGFALCAMFAATYPDRVSALIAFAPSGLGLRNAERPWAFSQQLWDEYLEGVREGWGTLAFAESEGKVVWPDIGDDAEWIRQFATWMRRSVGPGDAVAFLEIDSELDVRDLLPSVRTPTLVVQRKGDQSLPIEYGRYVAQEIAGAVLVELPGSNHGYMAPDQDEVLDHIERFIRGIRDEEAELDRVLATVLFTDIVGSTHKASELGDRSWKDLLERHHRAVRGLLARYRGARLTRPATGSSWSLSDPRITPCLTATEAGSSAGQPSANRALLR